MLFLIFVGVGVWVSWIPGMFSFWEKNSKGLLRVFSETLASTRNQGSFSLVIRKSTSFPLRSWM